MTWWLIPRWRSRGSLKLIRAIGSAARAEVGGGVKDRSLFDCCATEGRPRADHTGTHGDDGDLGFHDDFGGGER